MNTTDRLRSDDLDLATNVLPGCVRLVLVFWRVLISCDACGNRDACPIRAFQENLTGADRLVGIGMRCWLAGIDSGDISCWQTGWQRYAGELGEERVKSAFTELGCWARKLHANSSRKIEFESIDCPEFCRDECMLVARIAAGLIAAAEAGATAVIQPGGSMRDNEVIEAANKMGLAMVMTGMRHFQH